MKGEYFTAKKDGSVLIKLSKQGEPCSFIPLENSIAKRCMGFGLIETELTQAILFLRLTEDTEQHHALSLWHAAIMSYSRCFTKARGRKIKLDELQVKNISSDSVEFHRHIMGLRNDYVAHSGVNSINRIFMVLGLAPPSEQKGVENVFYLNIAAMCPQSEEIAKFITHCQLLIPIVTEMRVKVENRLLADYRERDIDVLYENSYSSEVETDDDFRIDYQ